MRREELVEELSGTGDVYTGTRRVGRVRYVITVTEDVFDDGRSVPARGLKTIAGRIAPADGEPAHLLSILIDYDDLRLDLEDGRSWHFFLANNGGHAVNRGGFTSR